ncbi:serine-threonine protein kinase 19-domain-containing protein [Xylariales sp. PMI_506]|nr:serine-threonine protein kinase 19-domain-containing protein [Xylariales sp. PMI_506]
MGLRSILGGSGRVKKATRSPGPKRSVLAKASPSKGSRKPKAVSHGEDDDYFGDEKLDDNGLLRALATDLNLRDTTQAIRYLRAHMFSPMPEQGSGMNSTRIAEVLNFRKHIPPIVTISHIQTLLLSPSVVEREVADLARSGFVRKIEVARRGEIGETLILASDLDQMIDESPHLSDMTKAHFKEFLRDHPGLFTVLRTSLVATEIDELFKAGFLTAHHVGTATLSNTMNLYSRPEDKTTLVSIENVSKQPTGTLGTVGGVGAVHNAGGSGGRAKPSLPSNATELHLAVPGNGAFLKLVSSALEHLVSLLSKLRHREAPESFLRERWDGGISKDSSARRTRGEFAGVRPGQTKKWKQFSGLSFDWVLQEATGAGLVEVFETGSVGRGIRII